MGGILAVFVGCVPAEVLRAPGWGLSGWLSRKVMENANTLSSVDLVEELLSGKKKLRMLSYSRSYKTPVSLRKLYTQVEQGSTIVELGPGHGFALRQILEKRPLRVYGVEISEPFRSILESDPAFRYTVHITSILDLNVIIQQNMFISRDLRVEPPFANPAPARVSRNL